VVPEPDAGATLSAVSAAGGKKFSVMFVVRTFPTPSIALIVSGLAPTASARVRLHVRSHCPQPSRRLPRLR
jgi:hypothetical protein